MERETDAPSLREVFQRLILLRLFIPLLIVGLTAISGISYLGKKNFEIQQVQIAQSMAQIVDHHLDQGGRTLEAVARVAEFSEMNSLGAVMKSTWEAYGYFDALYYLDKENKVKLLMPSDPRYLGLDMSNIPDFQLANAQSGLMISRPFISFRTGQPTVFLVRPLTGGGKVVGELNLGLFQQEILNITGKSEKGFILIMDQFGTLLANPSVDLVQQQTNMSNLEIFHHKNADVCSGIYLYEGKRVIGSAARVKRTGWIVVDQMPLLDFFSSYAWTLVIIFLFSAAAWVALVLNLRKKHLQCVIAPLENLGQVTNALAVGDFSQVKFLTPLPDAFAELNVLAADFKCMTNNLQARETALQQAKEELEFQVGQRTQELLALNKELQKLSSQDGLTGIDNRRSLENYLEQEWQRGIRQKNSLAVIMLDLDFFKSFNDVYGHQAGDDCLKQVAQTLKNVLKRSTDFAARYGGEEFITVLPGTDAAGAAVLAEEIRARIESLGIKHKQSSVSYVITVSLGVAAVVPEPGYQSAILIEKADQALYEAKHKGRNRVAVAENINLAGRE